MLFDNHRMEIILYPGITHQSNTSGASSQTRNVKRLDPTSKSVDLRWLLLIYASSWMQLFPPACMCESGAMRVASRYRQDVDPSCLSAGSAQPVYEDQRSWPVLLGLAVSAVGYVSLSIISLPQGLVRFRSALVLSQLGSCRHSCSPLPSQLVQGSPHSINFCNIKGIMVSDL